MEPLRDFDVVRAQPAATATVLREDPGAAMPRMIVRFSRFGEWYEVNSMWEGHFLERVKSGSFKRTIRNNGDQVRVLFNHGHDFSIGDKVLGPSENLREETDSPVGEVPLFDTSYNRDLLPGIRAGVYGSSFRMRVLQDEMAEPGSSKWEDTGNPEWSGLPQRTITEIRLFEYGPVTWPANPGATAGIDGEGPRSTTDAYYAELRARQPEFVDALRSRVAAARGVPVWDDAEERDGGCVDCDAEHDERATDNSAWDGGAAMSNCASKDSPAACYRSICAGRKAGDPSKQSAWALPHHKTPGGPANAAGVRNALSRLPQTQGLTNREAARRHLEAHMASISSKSGEPGDPLEHDHEHSHETPPPSDSTPPAEPAREDTPAAPGPAERTPDPAARHSDTPHTPAGEAGKPERTTSTMTVTDTRMTVEERQARQDEIRARLAEIDAEHSGATLPEEARTEWDALNTELDENEAAIAEATARMERLRALASRGGGHSEAGDASTRRTFAVSGPDARRAENIYDMGAIRQLARSVEELPQLYREHAMRSVEQARFGRLVTDPAAARAHVERLLHTVDDEDATLARSILITGSPLYYRAFGKFVKALTRDGLTMDEQRALALGAGGTGGFAVPYQLDPTVILVSDGSTSPLRRISRVEQITGKEWDGVTSTGITVTRKAEAAEADDNAPALLQPTVKAERVEGFVPFSFEIEQDWQSLLSEMTRLLNDAKTVEEDVSFITGTGVSPEANGLIGTNGIAVGSNVTANTFAVANLYALDEALPERFRDNASFLAHRSIYNAVRQFDTAGGANLWERIGNGMPPELLGYPAYRASAMPDATLSINDRYLILGDFQQFLIVDRLGMLVDVVPHLFGANRRPTGQRGLFAMWRNNCKVLASNAFRVLFKAA